MDPLLVSGLTVLITIISTTLVVSNYLHNRFSSHELADAKFSTELENVLYRINSNHELIEHRTNRFLETIHHYDALSRERETRLTSIVEARYLDLTNRIEAISKRASQMENYLVKSGFVVRD